MENPRYVRLPKAGQRLLSLSRSTIYKLITAHAANGYKPLVHSIVVKTHPHNKRGRRLIDIESLQAFMASCPTGWESLSA
ncbi:MAG TPA: hypothetical protein VGE29_09090 [Prosthecobacter sp.]